MSDSQQSQSAAAQTAARPAGTKIQVWDSFVRFLHWSLVISFTLSYWSAKAGKHELHAVLGYFVVGLVLARLFWGLYGSRYARFSNFIHAPATVLHYLKAIDSGHPPRYLGNNPPGRIHVVTLLATLVFITFTGLSVLAVIDFDGPLVGLMKTLTDQEAHAAWSSHAYAVTILLAMVGVHLLGVILASFQHKENLVRAMVTGLKDSDAETDVSPASQPETAGRQAGVYSKLAEGNKTI